REVSLSGGPAIASRSRRLRRSRGGARGAPIRGPTRGSREKGSPTERGRPPPREGPQPAPARLPRPGRAAAPLLKLPADGTGQLRRRGGLRLDFGQAAQQLHDQVALAAGGRLVEVIHRAGPL